MNGLFVTLSKYSFVSRPSIYTQGAAIFTGDWSAAGDAAEELFGFSSSRSGSKEIDVTNPDGSIKFDELLGCPLKRQTWEECKRAFFVPYDCKDKFSEAYPEQKCAEEKAAMIEQLIEDAEQGEEQDLCKEASKDRNQGLQFVNENRTAEEDNQVVEDLSPQLEPIAQSLGSAKALSRAGKCQNLNFDVNVKTLDSTSKGFDGKTGSGSGTSTECLDFSNNETLTDALEVFKQNSVAEKAADLSRGDQGLDKDAEVKKCRDVAEDACDRKPTLVYAAAPYDRKESATITCDKIDGTFKYGDYLGRATVNMDPSCTKRAIKFTPKQVGDSKDGCDNLTLEITRSVKDCCQQSVSDTQTLIIKPLPPTFTTPTGSLDGVFQCDANIHPTQPGVGVPEADPGCTDRLLEYDIDEKSSFDPLTCVTTVTRTWTVTQDMCEALT